MKTSLLMNFTVDKENKKIIVQREFAAPVSKVWQAWTESKWLDQWWAPKPWKARTKSMDFRVGGFWLYSMVGPEGEEQYARADYKSIEAGKSFSAYDAFCDAGGNIDQTFHRSLWNNIFMEKDGNTLVNITIKFDEVEHIEKIIELGFREGFTAALENLDGLFG